MNRRFILKASLTLVFALLFQLCSFAFEYHVMLGYVDMREACIWVQTENPCKISVSVNIQGSKSKSMIIESSTEGEFAFIQHIILPNLEPATTYDYTLAFAPDNQNYTASSEPYHFTTQALWQYRTDPPNFRLATGSCAFINEEQYDRPGKPYGGNYEIFESIAAKNPDLMLWLGDNIYLREVDFAAKSGIAHRYSHARALPEMQKLLSACAHYAIWDDHDFGPNDADRSYVHQDWTFEAFKNFWANPSYGIPGKPIPGGITTQFHWSDVEFFLLDNRSYRIPTNVVGSEEPTILGNDQINWLIEALRYSRAPFKIITMGGQFLNTEKKFENYSVWEKERQRILDAIQANNIQGVVFLSGDRHCGELSELKLTNDNVVYDLTVSPLTSTAYDNTKENNTLRVMKTLIPQRHFATLDFSGPAGKRVMKISTWDTTGKLLYEKEIAQPIKP